MPSVHGAPIGQAWKHAPQWDLFVVRSAQKPPQSVWPEVHMLPLLLLLLLVVLVVALLVELALELLPPWDVPPSPPQLALVESAATNTEASIQAPAVRQPIDIKASSERLTERDAHAQSSPGALFPSIPGAP